jgi:hypothetical protein
LAKANQTCTSLRCTRLSGVQRIVSGAQVGAPTNRPLSGKFCGLHNYNSPNCPVCQPHARQRSNTRSAGDTWLSQWSEDHIELFGVPPHCPVCNGGRWLQRSASPEKEGNRALFNVRWCPQIEGNQGLPNGTQTTSNCLRAIKGTLGAWSTTPSTH